MLAIGAKHRREKTKDQSINEVSLIFMFRVRAKHFEVNYLLNLMKSNIHLIHLNNQLCAIIGNKKLYCLNRIGIPIIIPISNNIQTEMCGEQILVSKIITFLKQMRLSEMLIEETNQLKELDNDPPLQKHIKFIMILVKCNEARYSGKKRTAS